MLPGNVTPSILDRTTWTTRTAAIPPAPSCVCLVSGVIKANAIRSRFSLILVTAEMVKSLAVRDRSVSMADVRRLILDQTRLHADP